MIVSDSKKKEKKKGEKGGKKEKRKRRRKEKQKSRRKTAHTEITLSASHELHSFKNGDLQVYRAQPFAASEPTPSFEILKGNKKIHSYLNISR